MSTFYPSGVLSLHLRLEEGLGPIPPEALAALRGQTLGTSGIQELQLLGQPVEDGFSHIALVQPVNVDHERNSPRVADTLSIDIAFRDLPLPARMIRSVGVQWYAGTVTPSDYAEGIQRAAAGGRNTAIIRPSRENLHFLGFADDIDEDHETGILSLRCRDFTGVLADSFVPASVMKGLELQKLDLTISDLLDTMPGGQAKGLQIATELDDTGQIPNLATGLPRGMLARKGKQPRLAASDAGSQISYWDLITTLCQSVGMIPIMDLDTLRIAQPRNVFSRVDLGAFSRVITTPNGAETLRLRRMVHGANLSGLRFSRKFGRLAVPAVEAKAWTPGGQLIVARWPPEQRASHVAPSGRGAHEKVEQLLVRGVTSPQRLTAIAQALYEEIGRSEYGGSFETHDLCSLGGSNEDPDLLRLASGDPVEVVAQARGQTMGLQNYLADLNGNPDAMVRRLEIQGGMKPDVARALVRVYVASAGLQTIFRVKESKISWNLGGDSPSVGIGVSFGTYLEVRSQQTAETSTPITSTVTV